MEGDVIHCVVGLLNQLWPHVHDRELKNNIIYSSWFMVKIYSKYNGRGLWYRVKNFGDKDKIFFLE